MKKIKKLVVSRSKWLRGTASWLYDGGRMCIMGFACAAAGVKKSKLRSKVNPNELGIDVPGICRSNRHSKLTENAIQINDSSEINDCAREEQLIKLFKSRGIALKFR